MVQQQEGMPANELSGTAEGASSQIIAVSDRQTEELVIALVGAIGSGVSTTAGILIDVMEREYNYSPHYIKVSSIIKELTLATGEHLPQADATPDDKTAALQKSGNVLRERYSNKYLAEKCIERIAVDRLSPFGEIPSGYQRVSTGSGQENELPVNRRRVHIIDSIKHTEELDALREVYGDTFWLLGVFAPEEVRKNRLKNLGYNAIKLEKILQDDEEDGYKFGQKVRDTVHQADFFIRNDALSEDRLRQVVQRYLKIIFNIGVNTPNQDEIAMYSAASQASTSACLSRQVGAAIYSEMGELIGVGANDVPKSGGGLYCSENGDSDHRCYKLSGGICHNDDRKEKLYNAIFQQLKSAGLVSSSVEEAKVKAVLKKTEIKNLIEYSRAVHAEMEAIMSVARGNKPGILGATLYCTTFPCHSCARHVVAAGIKRVVYIEPYAKSLAVSLHGDAVSMREQDARSRVVFLQYEGTAPKNMIRLFKHGINRKVDGKAIKADPRTAAPIFPSPLDGFTFREKMVVDNLLKIEQKMSRPTSAAGRPTNGKSAQEAAPAKLTLVDPNLPNQE